MHEGAQDIGRVARSGDGEEHVTRLAKDFNLARKKPLEAIVIGDGGEDRSVRGESDGTHGGTIVDKAADELRGEFFGTFLIPTIVHQDPHYHRMPDASIPRRAAHAILQAVWTKGDNGKDMVNYANLVGLAFDDEIGNFYVPGQQTNLPASAVRYGIAVASAPIENFIAEFMPDVARRIHIRVVVIQRIINQAAKTGGSG